MEKHYNLMRVRDLADGDEDFIKALASAFIEEVPEDTARLEKAVNERDYYTTYQAAHKMKPTIDLFELGVLSELVEVQDWGKHENQAHEDVSDQLKLVVTAVEKATAEIKKDFKL